MSDDTPSPLNNVITIDDERIKSHLDRVVRGTVEETLNALLDAEADRLCNAQRYERSEARRAAGEHVMICGGIYSFFDLWNARAPLRHYAITIGMSCGGFAVGEIKNSKHISEDGGTHVGSSIAAEELIASLFSDCNEGLFEASRTGTPCATG